MEFLTADKGDFITEIKRSEFIGKLVKVNNEDEAKSFTGEAEPVNACRPSPRCVSW